ncbi:MAG: cupin domain-containing protein [Anaerolineales bacterium]|nr:cupin domain-containing protein [Anaerolineales bacterium]
MSQVFDVSSRDWQPVRPDVTRGVFGKTLRDGKIKVVLTRVVPGGKFARHRDPYAHLFYFLDGEGTLWIDDQQIVARAGTVAQIDAGQEHAYENAGNEDLVLLSLNILAE